MLRVVKCYYSFVFLLLSFINIPKVPGIMESVTQPENQVLILSPFPPGLGFLDPG